MKQYWPMAIRKKDYGLGCVDTEPLFVSNGVDSLNAAMETLAVWKYDYCFDLVKCWIDVYENGKKLGTEEVWMDDIQDYRRIVL